MPEKFGRDRDLATLRKASGRISKELSQIGLIGNNGNLSKEFAKEVGAVHDELLHGRESLVKVILRIEKAKKHGEPW